MEPLTDVISLARPSGLYWKQLVATGEWAIRFPANDGVVFSYLVEGRCRFEAEERVEWLEQGDFVLLVRPPTWLLGTGADVEPTDYEPGHPSATTVDLGPGPRTITLGGRFLFEGADVGLIAELLPPLALVRNGEPRAARLKRLLDMLGEEATAARPGQDFMLGRLMELLLAEVVRDPRAASAETATGLLKGLSDPRLARALTALHGDVARRWTVADLAAEAGMSRSSFAAHFAQALGAPPLDYLLNWRMALARRALRGGAGLSAVAQAVGYGSVSAFSSAFKRVTGAAPSAYAAA